MKARVIAICNNKGGVGKTTTAASVGAALADGGDRVLLVDADPQANLTYALTPGTAEDKTLADVLFKGEPVEPTNVRGALDIVPGTLALNAAENALRGTDTLVRALDSVREKYDYIIIDTAPGVGTLTLSALSAADYVIITLTAEALPAKGMETIEEVIAEVSGAKVGYLITRYNNRLTLSKMVRDALRGRLGDAVFNTLIRENVALAEAPFSRTDIFVYAPKSNGARDYKDFTKELINNFIQ